jgi:glucose-1-phosphate cytidylyltransferase
MKVVLLAGGVGSRLSEETQLRPKPMVEIGGHPILWHIMMIYWSHGFSDFIVCLGYRGYMIKEYFVNYVLHRSDVTIDLATRSGIHKVSAAPALARDSGRYWSGHANRRAPQTRCTFASG